MGREGRKAFRGPSVGVQVLHASAHTVPCQEHFRRFYPDDSFLHLPRVCAKLTFQVTFPSTNAKGTLPPQLSELTFVHFSQQHSSTSNRLTHMNSINEATETGRLHHWLCSLEKRTTRTDPSEAPTLPHMKDNGKTKSSSGMMITLENKMDA